MNISRHATNENTYEILLFFQAEKEEQAAKEIAPTKEFTSTTVEATGPAPEPGWANEVETTAVATENWADDVAPPTAAPIPAATTTQSFPTGGDWAAQVREMCYVIIDICIRIKLISIKLYVILIGQFFMWMLFNWNYHLFSLQRNGQHLLRLLLLKAGEVQAAKSGNLVISDVILWMIKYFVNCL